MPKERFKFSGIITDMLPHYTAKYYSAVGQEARNNLDLQLSIFTSLEEKWKLSLKKNFPEQIQEFSGYFRHHINYLTLLFDKIEKRDASEKRKQEMREKIFGNQTT